MIRSALLFVCLASPAMAQAPALRFQWPKDQALDYRVRQTTKVSETVVDAKSTSPATATVTTVLELTKRWTIRDVDSEGVATIDLSVTQMKQSVTRGDGKTSTIDSTNPEDARQMASFLNKAVLTLRVDARGQILEVKETRPGSASRIQTELPFRVILPEMAIAAGATWARPFTITLDPPHGTGERYDATQAFSLKSHDNGQAVIALETSLKAPPATASEKLPLVPMLWSGEVTFHSATGRYTAARLTAKAELTNHQGDGSKFVFESVYNEDLTP